MKYLLPIALTILLAGCTPALKTDALAGAGNRVDNLGTNLGSASDEANRLAESVKREAEAGKAATPATLVEAHQHWYAILQLVDPLRQFAGKLKGFVADAGQIKADVEQAKLERAKLEKELADARSETTRKLTAMQTWIAILAALGVAVMLWLKNYKGAIALAGGALAGVAILWFAIGLHAITKPFFLTLGAAAGLGVLWLIAETIYRKGHGAGSWGAALSESVRTPPWQDIEDLLDKRGKAPVPVAAVDPQAQLEQPVGYPDA